jgi:predicted PurR-regulated permease PerM
MALRRWLVGQFFAMLLVGTLTTIGLLILGVPLALTLGIFTFFLVFVPYVGSIVSGALAVLIALLDSPQTALYAGLLYGGIQFVESYFITPLVQEKVVSLPPVLLLASQFLLGVLAGAVGIALATPLSVAVVVLVQMLYVEDVLGDDVPVMGTKGRY